VRLLARFVGRLLSNQSPSLTGHVGLPKPPIGSCLLAAVNGSVYCREQLLRERFSAVQSGFRTAGPGSDTAPNSPQVTAGFTLYMVTIIEIYSVKPLSPGHADRVGALGRPEGRGSVALSRCAATRPIHTRVADYIRCLCF
jgi:hypothetical protein